MKVILQILKVAQLLFVLILIPVYWVKNGPANFLWFSDIALFISVPAFWFENSYLASVAAVSVLPLELIWNFDCLAQAVTGRKWIGLASYMFDPDESLVVRILSGCFHIGLPILLIFMIRKFGYDRRALKTQTLICWLVLPLVYFLTDPQKNIDWVFGLGDMRQTLIAPPLYLFLLLLAFPLFVYLPTDAALSRIGRGRR